VLPNRPNLTREPEKIGLNVYKTEEPSSTPSMSVTVEMGQNEVVGEVHRLTGHIEIEDATTAGVLESGGVISASQGSACTMTVFIKNTPLSIKFPYPINGAQHKLRIARKSHYIEVVPFYSELNGAYSSWHRLWSPSRIPRIRLATR
jgi:hypothetical protein